MKDMSFLRGVPGCVIGRHEVSLQKEDMLKCPDDEIGSSPGSGAGLQEEGERSLFTTEDESVCMMGCDGEPGQRVGLLLSWRTGKLNPVFLQLPQPQHLGPHKGEFGHSLPLLVHTRS